jgi:hypothetical protein
MSLTKVTYSMINGAPVNVDDFGADPTGVADSTAALQAMFDSLPSVVVFSPGAVYKTGVLEIKGSCHIIGNNATLNGTALGLFNCKTACARVWVEGFNVTWVSGTGTLGRQFFWNDDQVAGSTAFAGTNAYSITDLRIFNNNLGAAKVACYGLTSEIRVYGNRWDHDNTVAISPAYLIAIRGTTDDVAGPVWIQNNYFRVYPPTGLNEDIIKVSGGVSDAQITDNYILNKNTSAWAQVDVFTGAYRMRFANNTLINTRLERKQVKGALPAEPALYGYDYIGGNLFEVESGYPELYPIYFIGATGSIVNNQFKIRNTTGVSYGIFFDRSDVDYGFGTDASFANIVSGNLFDLRACAANSSAIFINSAVVVPASAPAYFTINGNILIGTDYMVKGGGEQYSTIFGNVWAQSSGGSGTGINGGGGNTMLMGNVVDSSGPTITGVSEGNVGNLEIPTLAAGATPDVSTGSVFFVDSATPITNFLGGTVGKKITLFVGSNTTIVDGSTIKLNGATNFAMDNFGDSLTLMKTTATRWNEIGRSNQ